jgi:hypothetical protein
MTKRFPVRKLLAISWCVYRQNGYQLLKAGRNRKSSAKMLGQMIRMPQDQRDMAPEDWDRADEQLDLIRGLTVKSMERERGLTRFELTLLELVKDEHVDLRPELTSAVAAVPEMLQTQKQSDAWYEIERAATGSVHLGNPDSYGEIFVTVTPYFTQRVRNGFYGNSTFVAGLDDSGNVVKFFLYDAESQKIEIGKPVKIRGRVREHSVSETGANQTMLRQVYLDKRDEYFYS